MAVNVDRPNGFTPVGTINGAPWTGYCRVYEADTDASNIFVGDLVKLEGDGQIDVCANGDTPIGVVVGALNHLPTLVNGKMDFSLSNSDPTLHPSYSSAKGLLLVAVGPDVLYEVQEDGDTTPLTIAAIGANVDVLATAGDTTTGRSKMEINSDGNLGTGTANLRIVNIVDRPDNQLASIDSTKPNCRWIVRLNEYHFTGEGGVIGVGI